MMNKTFSVRIMLGHLGKPDFLSHDIKADSSIDALCQSLKMAVEDGINEYDLTSHLNATVVEY